MDDRRFRIYVSLIAVLFLMAFGRALLNTNPIYDTLEPILAELNSFSSEIALIGEEASEPDQQLVDENELLKSENERLRSEFGIKLEQESIPSEITRRDLNGFSKVVWVDRGRQDGIRVGQTVIHRGSLFGRVEAVFDQSARIRTVLDPDFRATININEQQGVLKVSSGSLLADLVPAKDLSGAPVETDGLDGETVTNLYVGRLDKLVSEESSIFGTYNVLLPFSVFDVQFVEILISEGVNE